MLPPVGTEMEDTMIKNFIIPLDPIGGPGNGWGHPNVKKNKYSTAKVPRHMELELELEPR